MLKVYIGEELIVEGGEQRLDVRFVEAGALEDDDRAGDRAIGEVVEVDRRDIIPAALGKKSFGRSRAEGAFKIKFQVFSIQFLVFSGVRELKMGSIFKKQRKLR